MKYEEKAITAKRVVSRRRESRINNSPTLRLNRIDIFRFMWVILEGLRIRLGFKVRDRPIILKHKRAEPFNAGAIIFPLLLKLITNM